MDERILEIEEKEDNHIAYLETQLEGLSLAEDLDAKQSEAWLEIGKPIVEKISQAIPLLIPMIPSTSLHVKIANSVASVVRSEDADPTALSKTRKRVKGEDRGKIDDKGKLLPRLIVQPRAAPSARFMGVSLPLSPHFEDTLH